MDAIRDVPSGLAECRPTYHQAGGGGGVNLEQKGSL